jgi:alkyl sulfatase BDS1-like metallo-beta-lactamase superfamily hydrolase
MASRQYQTMIKLYSKFEEDGHFIWAVKVVDNVLSISTSQHLNEQLITVMEQSGYTVKDEAPVYRNVIRMERIRRPTSTSSASRRQASYQV